MTSRQTTRGTGSSPLRALARYVIETAWLRPRTRSLVAAVLGASAVVVAVSCSSQQASTTSSAPGKIGSTALDDARLPPACQQGPATPRVIATLGQWRDITEQLAAGCVQVEAILDRNTGDPHDFEPTPAQVEALRDASVIILNGLGYDEWARKAIDTFTTKPVVIDLGEVVGLRPGANPHLWYSPRYLRQAAGAISGELSRLVPLASSHFDAAHTTFERSMQRYDEIIGSIRSRHAGQHFAATEPVFDYMADALGLVNSTPDGYQRSAANHTDPPPGDLASFQQAIRSTSIRVLIDNRQTASAIADQLKELAVQSGVPVVEMAESAGQGNFFEWQVGQLERLDGALSVGGEG